MVLSAKAKHQLATEGFYLEEDMPGIPGPEKDWYHNPRTGQEFPNLPIDPYSVRLYGGKGWRRGPASDELRLAWQGTVAQQLDKKITDAAGVHESQLRLL